MTSIDNDYYYKNYQSLEFHLGLPSLKKSIEVHFKRLRYFYCIFTTYFMKSLYEKKISAEVRVIHAEQIPLQNLIILWKKN